MSDPEKTRARGAPAQEKVHARGAPAPEETRARGAPVPEKTHARGAPAPETPVASPPATGQWGSDAIADMLRALDIRYVALNPGASYRGLHDSLVNHLGNHDPQILLCLHEESAVSIAHGYAKVTGRMMGALLHSNVGLLHATMSIFNAWCDRVPMLIVGATGPVDATKRRPWIDWIHTAADQGALVRDYTKWDDQPASIVAALDALARAAQLAATPPQAPVYVNLDAALQEAPLAVAPPMPELARFAPAAPSRPDAAALADAARQLAAARRPLMLAGRGSRAEQAWTARIALAERLQARVVTDLKLAAAFPTNHPLHAAPPGAFLDALAIAALRDADVVLALDWVDLAGTLRQAFGDARPPCAVVNVSLDAQLARGWSKDHFGLPPADVYIACDPDVVVAELRAQLGTDEPRRGEAAGLSAVAHRPAAAPSQPSRRAGTEPADDALTLAALARIVDEVTHGVDVCITRLPLAWHGAYRHFRHPLDYIGLEGGGGVGAGPGITIGAALALKGSGRLPLAIMGDGDFLMGVTALWTAVHYRLPCAIVVANNRSFYNDEVHQQRVAVARSRPVANKWIGQRIDDPAIDLAAMARAQGAEGFGPVDSSAALRAALERALQRVAEGAVVVVDARVTPDAAAAGAAVAVAPVGGAR
jgi:thiamine pyrophosphate-dependent acetolactate synthase large subunit-like protein